ncbi:unnamed protein product [Prorocentrum cordatum]|uniref:UBC core domain-containing protein n=1 Tax=Prorocentrum cordatum TaxID=2364126 RepID=A0ABN9UL10_9DINO|nr:unnamed protein product [Polarella glacialis]
MARTEQAAARDARHGEEPRPGKGGGDISIEMQNDTIENWSAVIRGPKDSPFEGGKFELRLQCSVNYPMSPPSEGRAWFVTKVFHPNVSYPAGEICLDILKSQWSPAWTLQYVCRAIAMMSDPNADSPLNCDAGNLVRRMATREATAPWPGCTQSSTPCRSAVQDD